MTEARTEREETALALQREIQDARAALVSDIDRLRGAVRERMSLRYVLRAHPRVAQALTIALALGGAATFALLWRATAARRRDGSR